LSKKGKKKKNCSPNFVLIIALIRYKTMGREAGSKFVSENVFVLETLIARESFVNMGVKCSQCIDNYYTINILLHI